MDFNLNDDQRQFADLAQQFARDEFAPFAAQWDIDHHFPKEVIQRAGELGFALFIHQKVKGAWA